MQPLQTHPASRRAVDVADITPSPRPFGAAIARLSHPAGASEGGGEGAARPFGEPERAAHRRWFANSAQHGVKDVMVFVRSPYVLISFAAGLAAALWLGRGALPVSPMDASTIAHAVAVAATCVVAVLATAVGALMVSDWQADVQSRHDWAQLGLTPAHVSLSVELSPQSDLDPRYLAPTSDEALRLVFRTYRAAAPMRCSVPARAQSAELVSVKPVPDHVSDTGAASEGDASRCASLRAVDARPAAVQAVVPSWKGKRREKVMAGRPLLVANGDAWRRWTAGISPPTERTAEVIVLSASQDDRAQPQSEVSDLPDGADSTARPACRGPPQLAARRRDTAEPAAGQRRDECADSIIVSDDLGPQIPVGAAELEVIETYLGHLLDDLLASSTTAKSDSDKG